MNLASWARSYERAFNVMNLKAWSENYEKVFNIIHFNVKEWVMNYEEKILNPRMLSEEIQRLQRIEAEYNRERRERLRQRREEFNKLRIKHQLQEVEAIKRVREQGRPKDIRLYCAAPAAARNHHRHQKLQKQWII